MKPVKRPTAAFVGVILFITALYLILVRLQGVFEANKFLSDYTTWQNESASRNMVQQILWIFGDMTEPYFHKSYLGAFGLILGAVFAQRLYRRNSKYMGFPIGYGTGIWPWMFFAGFSSLVLSNLLFAENLYNGWFPTFVPFVSIASATVLMYGRSWKVFATAVIMGCVVTVPVCYEFMTLITTPLGIPGVAGSVSGMWIGGIVCFEVYRILPWMHLPQADTAPLVPRDVFHRASKPNQFFLRRILADFSEPCFCNNEYVGVGIILGSLFAWWLNPFHVTYGTGTFPAVLFAQVLTSAISIYVYYDRWVEEDWFPTFPSVVSVAPGMAMLWSGNIWVAVISAIFGGIVCPGIANMVIKKMPAHWHALVGTTFSMTLGAILCGGLILCIQSILPL